MIFQSLIHLTKNVNTFCIFCGAVKSISRIKTDFAEMEKDKKSTSIHCIHFNHENVCPFMPTLT